MVASEQKTKSDLEWAVLVGAVTARCCGPLTEATSLPIAQDFETAKRALAETREALTLLRRGDPLPLTTFVDVRPHLRHIEREGVLDGPALNELCVALSLGRSLRRFVGQRREVAPFLQRACGTDPTLDALEDDLRHAVGEDGVLHDRASTELARLRTEAANLRQRLIRQLDALIQRHAAILQDNYYTLREGRYVLPLRADAHERFPGIVHGSSASGATLFIEPRELVDRGNRLKMVQAELEREEQRVLAALSALVAQRPAELRALAEALDRADLRAASARLGVALDAHVIELVQEPVVQIREGRHPLLLLEGAQVVPNDLELRGGEALVISGPNAGGKTVALKMAGLVALMMRAGLPVSVEQNSRCGFFQPVLSCIGDDQSLSRNLSTFSAHVETVSKILAAAGDRVLVLLDELTSGTDPEAGAALACAIVEALCEKGAAVCVTTHYEPLKALGAARSNMKNAAVGFDMERMLPTFELLHGVPGASSALEVAQRFGLPPDVIAAARRVLPAQSQKFDKLVGALQSQRDQLEAEQRKAVAAHAEVERVKDELASELAAQRQRDRKALSEEARGLAERMREARRQIDALRREERIRKREDRRTLGETLKSAVELLQDAEAQALPVPPQGERLGAGEFAVGDRVWIDRLRSSGEVIECSSRGQVRVAAGMMKLWVEHSELQRLKRSESSTRLRATEQGEVASAAVPPTPVRTRENTLDLRGLRVDEALALTEAFLDRMYGAAEGCAFILHGLGTGALRDAVHQQLAADQTYIESYRPASRDEGGAAITVVSLK